MTIGGDKTSDNFKVWDIRESAPVRQRFGQRTLQNPLKTADFGFATADEAEPGEDMDTDAAASLQNMSLTEQSSNNNPKPSKTGAAGKFKKKGKEKKKKIKNF